jgi:hypothetical protein
VPKHLTIDEAEPMEQPSTANPAPYGYRKDGVTPRNPPGRPKVNLPPNVPNGTHAAPPLRRNNPRPPPRPESTRQMAREPSRQNAVVYDREGNEISRMRPNAGGDIFDRVKPPKGWSYQWNAITAVNKELIEIHQGMAIDMYENGWRPVPASRHPGVYTPPGYEGAIVVKGQRLEERPEQLTEQALREDEARAKAQLRDQTDSLRLTQSKLPGANAGRARQVSGMRMEIDRSFEVPPDTDSYIDPEQ